MLNNMTDDNFPFKERMMKIARQCIAEEGERPELRRLKEIYECKRAEYGIGKAAMDALLYERICGSLPQKPSDTLKLRYWRTGRHYPVNREVCTALARALELEDEGSRWLLTAWMDRSADFYKKVPPCDDEVYWSRRNRLQDMAAAYVNRRLSTEKGFTYGAFRHCYYLDALKYVNPDEIAAIRQKSIYSINYDSELKRSALLLGEIPRKTMLRHLILLSLPELTRTGLSEDLSFFGYLPLTSEHTLTGGEYLDRLVIENLRLYERIMEQYGPDEAMCWFCRCWRMLDKYFVAVGKPGFRLFYFKALG